VGYLTRVKVRGHYYVRVEHVEGGKRRVCYLGRDRVEVVERPLHMQRVRGGKKGRWLLTLVSNPT
jgi:hypothetical protein